MFWQISPSMGSVCTREVIQDYVTQVTLPIAPNHEGNSGGHQYKKWSLCKVAIGWFGNAGRQEQQRPSWWPLLVAPKDRRRRRREMSAKPWRPFWTQECKQTKVVRIIGHLYRRIMEYSCRENRCRSWRLVRRRRRRTETSAKRPWPWPFWT